jgi:hypothetical protein
MTKRALAEFGVACTRRIPLGTLRTPHGRRRRSSAGSRQRALLQLARRGGRAAGMCIESRAAGESSGQNRRATTIMVVGSHDAASRCGWNGMSNRYDSSTTQASRLGLCRYLYSVCTRLLNKPAAPRPIAGPARPAAVALGCSARHTSATAPVLSRTIKINVRAATSHRVSRPRATAAIRMQRWPAKSCWTACS